MTLLETTCGIVPLIGPPNAGKSTLLNHLLNEKISIVTAKPQTTRNRILGVLTVPPSQIIFADTPGIFLPKTRLDRAMVDAAWSAIGEADIICLLVDATKGITSSIDHICKELSKRNSKVMVLINKSDLIKQKEELLPLMEKLHTFDCVQEVFIISAAKGEGVSDFLKYITSHLPKGPWLFPEDQLTDIPLRLLASEITREQVFLKLHKELPYESTVSTESWEEFENGSLKITQTIYVQRDSQRPIVLGEKGLRLKAIGKSARFEMTRLFKRPVHLFLHIKVDPRWQDKPNYYKELGLSFKL